MEKISIVVPCYNESGSLAHLFDAFERYYSPIPDIDFEYLFIDDGSTDNTLAIIKRLKRENERVRYISFSRNFGKEAAILAGLEHSTGDYVVLMDADLQDSPDLLIAMYNTLKEESLDCVAARRVTRSGEPLIRSFFARLFYKLNNLLSDVKILEGTRDYRIMTREMVDSIISLKERSRFSKGLFAWVGYRTKTIEYDNVQRKGGQSGWSFFKLLMYSIEGLVSFSTKPLLLVALLGIVSCIAAFIMILYFIAIKLFQGIAVTGYAAMICIILFLGGIQLLSMGILGQYLARVFVEVKGRPVYIIKEISEKLYE